MSFIIMIITGLTMHITSTLLASTLNYVDFVKQPPIKSDDHLVNITVLSMESSLYSIDVFMLENTMKTFIQTSRHSYYS